MTDIATKRLEKRYQAHKRRFGTCSVCLHRQRERDGIAEGHCRNNPRRFGPDCEFDGGVKFAVDVDVVNKMKDRGVRRDKG